MQKSADFLERTELISRHLIKLMGIPSGTTDELPWTLIFQVLIPILLVRY